MKANKNFKLPFFMIIGIGFGLIISNVFIFSGADNNNDKQNTDDLDKYQTPYTVFQPHIPENVYFCGEQVPLENFDVYESLDLEMIANTYRHSMTILYLKRANRFFPEIEKLLKENGIPDDMKYICVAESGFANLVSPAGATGFWQIMKTTGLEYNLTIDKNIDERYNHYKSNIVAIDYFKKAYNYFGNWTLVAASYNMGMGGLKKNLDFQRVKSYWDLNLNEETSRYVYRIIALKLIMSDPESYGFNIPEDDLYREIKTIEITVDSSINDLVQFAFDQGTNYKMLKYFNPWIMGSSLINLDKKEYKIKIPVKGERDCYIPEE
ncbi:MAG: lytic transglycosylase domain-containing protein [Bacteroidales bacterium]|nr:lytic transglycosylase domain-containing protein [Bacteroidales bacterium]MDD3859649.1 lytic transglycosylase domain-containing protein [Bacteroidales bacterium]